MTDGVYGDMRAVLAAFLRPIVQDVVVLAEHGRRFTVRLHDVTLALKRRGRCELARSSAPQAPCAALASSAASSHHWLSPLLLVNLIGLWFSCVAEAHTFIVEQLPISRSAHTAQDSIWLWRGAPWAGRARQASAPAP